jgi:hypothetical protein
MKPQFLYATTFQLTVTEKNVMLQDVGSVTSCFMYPRFVLLFEKCGVKGVEGLGER